MKPMLLSELRPGDVLLCFKDAKFDVAGKLIAHVTKSDYTHAAICINQCTAAESLVSAGVRRTRTHDLVQRYDHVAVFRQPDAWQSAESVQALNTFIDSVIESGAKYNLREVATFSRRQDVHQLSLTEQLQEFFKGDLAPSPTEKGSYFCSELVADCFVATGFIQPSAAVVYRSNVTSPGALGRDPTFGTFVGYVSVAPNYTVPTTDEFFNSSTLSEIYGSDA